MNLSPVLFLFLFFVVLNASCTSEQNDTESHSIEKLSRLTCEASELREARFALADSIRFYQDSVMHSDPAHTDKIQIWENNLKKMMHRKTRLTTMSRDLADSIRVELQILTQDMSQEEKRDFNKNLQKIDCPGQ